MGQLIKLQDYISRYEVDMFRYPSQFIRLKKQQWEKVTNAWEEGTLHTVYEPTITNDKFDQFEEKRPLLPFLKRPVKQNTGNTFTSKNEEGMQTIEWSSKPRTMSELKQQFLDQILDFQMKWASSTVREKSYVDKEFYQDPNLKYFLQRFPDTYLILYRPIFLLKKAPVEVEIILVSPTTTWLITILEGDENSVFLGSNERFWTERNGKQEKKVLSPLIALDRMEGIVRTIYSLHSIELPIRKVILNRTGYFDFPLVPYDIELIESRNYETWFSSLRNVVSPLKHMQLKAGNALLQYCQTVCVRRMD
ncbi:NERD domain-containing protein [Ferdinandcohnia sp. Marseille-Q9671]